MRSKTPISKNRVSTTEPASARRSSSPRKQVAGLLLAAGRSSRFGSDKLLASLDGRPVIHWSAAALCAATDEVLVVIRPDAMALRAALRDSPVRFVENSECDGGMSSSIAAGIRVIDARVAAVVIALGDQPLISEQVIRALIARWRQDGAPAVATRYRDGHGHPVLFGRECFATLMTLEGDQGARTLLSELGASLGLIDVDALTPLDVDTPDMLARLQDGLRTASR